MAAVFPKSILRFHRKENNGEKTGDENKVKKKVSFNVPEGHDQQKRCQRLAYNLKLSRGSPTKVNLDNVIQEIKKFLDTNLTGKTFRRHEFRELTAGLKTNIFQIVNSYKHPKYTLSTTLTFEERTITRLGNNVLTCCYSSHSNMEFGTRNINICCIVTIYSVPISMQNALAAAAAK